MPRVNNPIPSWVWTVALVVLGCGCGGPSTDKVCADQAAARCTKFDECQGNQGVLLRYGDLSTCKLREAKACTATLNATPTSRTPQQVEDCVTALPKQSCGDFLSNNPPAACQAQPGTLAANASCAFDAQCQSAFCAIPRFKSCGTCQPPPAVGSDCSAYGTCGYNQACLTLDSDGGVATSAVCVAFAAVGTSCDRLHPCSSSLSCVGSSTLDDGGVVQGTCQQRAKTAGAPCDPRQATSAGCDPNLGLFCDGRAQLCVAFSNAGPGSSCAATAVDGGSVLSRCTFGASCIAGSGGSTCIAPVIEGGSCDTLVGPPCLAPARCVTIGVPGPGTCIALDSALCQ